MSVSIKGLKSLLNSSIRTFMNDVLEKKFQREKEYIKKTSEKSSFKNESENINNYEDKDLINAYRNNLLSKLKELNLMT